MTAAVVVRNSTRTWLKCNCTSDCGMWWDAAHRALTLALEHVGLERIDWDEYLVRSGEACAAIASDVYHGTSFLAAAFDPLTEAARSYGFSPVWQFPASPAAALAAVRSEIGEGRPVVAGGAAPAFPASCWGLISGYDTARPSFRFCGYRGGVRWLDVEASFSRSRIGLWQSRIRGLLTPDGKLWYQRPLFLLGEQLPRSETSIYADALRAALRAMNAPARYVDRFGGITYYHGLSALAYLAQNLPHIDYPDVLHQASPPAAEGWYCVPDVVADCSDIVLRGRQAAARVFARWAAADARLRPLAELVPLLEASVAAIEPVWCDLAIRLAWEQDDPSTQREWRRAAAAAFAAVLQNDRACLAVITRVLEALEADDQ